MNLHIDLYGMELEFGSELSHDQVSNELSVPMSICNLNHSWEIGVDETASSYTHYGYELRSPIFSVFPEDELRRIIKKLSNGKMCATETSGLHFHFSGPSYINFGLDKEKTYIISRMLYTLAKVNPKRKTYCNPNVIGQNGAIRHIIDTHWECRVFNSVFDYDLIIRNFDLMRRFLCK